MIMTNDMLVHGLKLNCYLDGLITRRLNNSVSLQALRNSFIRIGMKAAQFDARVIVVRKLARKHSAQDRKAAKRLDRRDQ